VSALPASPPFGLPPATLDKLRSVFARHPAVERVVLYGSRAKGSYRPGSDIDLAIKGGQIDFAELLKIEDEIDDLLLPYCVDLSLYGELANADLIDHIDRVGVDVYARQSPAAR